MEKDIETLVDMGIPQNVAKSALLRCNGNVSDAINYVYEHENEENIGEDDISYSETDAPIYGMNDSNFYASQPNYGRSDSTPIQVSDQIRSKLALSISETSEANHNAYTDAMASYGYGTQLQPMEYSNTDVIHVPPPYDVFTDIAKTKRSDDRPPVLLANTHDHFESFLAALIMILSNVPKFRNSVLGFESDVDYGFVPNWWKSGKCSNCTSVMEEIQRLVAFLDPSSQRAFASIKTLRDTANKMPELYNQLSDAESMVEFSNIAFSTIRELFSNHNDQLKSTFSSLFTSTICERISTREREEIEYDRMRDEENEEKVEQKTTDFCQIPVELEDTFTTIYHALHNVFWGEGVINSSALTLTKIADVLPIVFEGSDSIRDGFELEEVIYPEIYSEEFKLDMQRKFDQLKVIDRRLDKASRQLFQLKSFKNVPVSSSMQSVAEHLEDLSLKNPEDQSTKDAFADLTSILNRVSDAKAELAESLQNLNTQKRSANIYDVGYLTEGLEKKLQPWVLIGVIFKEAIFFSKLQGSERAWYAFESECENRDRNFDIEPLEFENIRDFVSNGSKGDLTDGMTLIYVKKPILDSEDRDPIAPKLADFIDKDNTQLLKDLQDLEASSFSRPVPEDKSENQPTFDSDSEEELSSEEDYDSVNEDEYAARLKSSNYPAESVDNELNDSGNFDKDRDGDIDGNNNEPSRRIML